MSRRESLTRLSLIISHLRKRPSTFEEINHFLERQSDIDDYNYTISKRTFQRDIEEISSIFQIEIKYNPKLRLYCIEYDGQDEAQARIMEAFDTIHMLNMHDHMAKFIYFESRRHQGTQHLYGLLNAIKNKHIILFNYQKFWEDGVCDRTVEPYALKEFRYRWYLMAKDKKDNTIKSFALDRMSDIEFTSQGFMSPEDLNIELSYKYCFGIIQPGGNETPDDILLSFDTVQGQYIKSLPLHHTQKVVFENNKEIQISLQLYSTYDFVMELMSYGNRVKVLQPSTLAAEIRNMHQKAEKVYSA